MQQFTTPQAGRRAAPNIVDQDDYKLHVLKRQYAPGEWEILIERWIPETAWTRTQVLMSQKDFDKFISVLSG